MLVFFLPNIDFLPNHFSIKVNNGPEAAFLDPQIQISSPRRAENISCFFTVFIRLVVVLACTLILLRLPPHTGVFSAPDEQLPSSL